MKNNKIEQLICTIQTKRASELCLNPDDFYELVRQQGTHGQKLWLRADNRPSALEGASVSLDDDLCPGTFVLLTPEGRRDVQEFAEV